MRVKTFAVSLVLLGAAAPSAMGAGFGPAEPFALAGGQLGDTSSLVANRAGSVVSIWNVDAGVSQSAPRPPAVQLAMQQRDGRSRTFALGRIADDTRSHVVLDDAGVATVAWDQHGQSVSAARCTIRGCSSVVRLGQEEVPEPQAPFSGLSLAGNTAGRVVALWPGKTSRGSRLQFRIIEHGRYLPVGTLSEAGRRPTVAAVGRRFVAIWNGEEGVRTAVLGEHAHAFSRPRSALREAAPPALQVVAGRKGLLVSWHRGPSELMVTTVDGNGRFAWPQAISGVGPTANRSVSLAQGHNGRAVLAFMDCDGSSGPAPLFASIREAGGEFGSPVQLGGAGSCNISTAVDATGRATVGWADEAPDGRGFAMTATAEPGAPFAAATQLDASCVAPCSEQSPGLVAPGRSTVAAWISATADGSAAVRAARSAAGQTTAR
jgi:hypothetical protein